MSKLAEKQLELIIAGTTVQRYHAVPTIQRQTVGEHSARVALIANLLQSRHGSDHAVNHWALILQALVHDLPEGVFGDIPAPVKRGMSPELRKLVNEQEEELLHDCKLSVLLTSRQEKLLKLADSLEGVLFCRTELLLGNRHPQFLECYRNFRRYTAQMCVELQPNEDQEAIVQLICTYGKEQLHEEL